jgi:hypothetical protein
MKSGLKILGIRADWKALTFCVIAAATFWFFNAMNHDYTIDVFYPIEIKYDESKVIPTSPIPEKIKINVTGYGWDILFKYLGLKTKPIVYTPSNLPKRKQVSADQLTPIIVSQISDIRFNYMIRDTLFFKFDYLKQKKVRVTVDTASIKLSPSYKITTPIVINPEYIIIQGAASALAKIPNTVKIELNKTDISENFEEGIKIPEQGFQSLEVLNKEVKVRFGVEEFEKQSTVVKIKKLNFPKESSGVNFDQEVILTYFIKEEDKNKVSPKDFVAVLNYKKLDKSDTSIKPVLIQKPSFVKDYYFTPYAVKIKVRK